MQTLTNRVRPAIEKYGEHAQRAKFYTSLMLLAFRRDRYVVSEKTLDFTRLALEASKAADEIHLISASMFHMGFSLLWYGEPEKAVEFLQAAIEMTEQTGDVILRSRCLCYLTISYRRLRNVEHVRELLPACFNVAASGDMIEYEAQAHANSSWAALQDGDMATAKKHASEALHIWYEVIPDPVKAFQWTVIWPMLFICHKEKEIKEAVQLCKIALDRAYQKMPDALEKLVHEIVRAWENKDEHKTVDALEKAITLASELLYL
jgi:tetratricopeptide (TPR) repeat protein